jgi:hypothetical protein
MLHLMNVDSADNSLLDNDYDNAPGFIPGETEIKKINGVTFDQWFTALKGEAERLKVPFLVSSREDHLDSFEDGVWPTDEVYAQINAN